MMGRPGDNACAAQWPHLLVLLPLRNEQRSLLLPLTNFSLSLFQIMTRTRTTSPRTLRARPTRSWRWVTRTARGPSRTTTAAAPTSGWSPTPSPSSGSTTRWDTTSSSEIMLQRGADVQSQGFVRLFCASLQGLPRQQLDAVQPISRGNFPSHQF